MGIAGHSIILTGICVVLVFLLAWLYWSFAVVRWKLRAFKNVRNVHELKQRAILEQIMRSDEDFFTRTEIWTREQREQWLTLQSKFETPDLFTDDYTVPSETVIRYSRNQKLFFVALMLLMFFTGCYLMLYEQDYLSGVALSVFGFAMTIVFLRQYLDRNRSWLSAARVLALRTSITNGMISRGRKFSVSGLVSEQFITWC